MGLQPPCDSTHFLLRNLQVPWCRVLLQASIIQELFEANVFRLLVKKELIGNLITKMRSWKHKGFQVYARPQMTEKEDILRMGLYIIRLPASDLFSAANPH